MKIQTVTETVTEHPAIDALRESLREIELDVLTSFTLADAIREGAGVTLQKTGGWVDQNSSCALGAAFLSARARGFVGE